MVYIKLHKISKKLYTNTNNFLQCMMFIYYYIIILYMYYNISLVLYTNLVPCFNIYSLIKLYICIYI